RQHQDRCAHGADELIRRHMAAGRARVDPEPGGDGVVLDFRPQLTQQPRRGQHVLQVWDVGDFHGAVGQQRGAQDRQDGVLRPGDGDFAVKGGAAGDEDLLHSERLFPDAMSPSRGNGVPLRVRRGAGAENQPSTWSGVSVRRARAWISPVSMRSPKVAYTMRWRASGSLPRKASDTTSASKWTPSSPRTSTRAPGMPCSMSSRMMFASNLRLPFS